ncbi:MAG: hypothetical protein KGL70_16685 [Betaproteobacteria bacterium]|nr:hypothetical protein [Betaproteobacteria bacterium]
MPWVGASPDLASASTRLQDEAFAREQQGRLDQAREFADSRLCSSKEVVGYEIMATDGPIGSIEAFVFDDESWATRYMVVDTRKTDTRDGFVVYRDGFFLARRALRSAKGA